MKLECEKKRSLISQNNFLKWDFYIIIILVQKNFHLIRKKILIIYKTMIIFEIPEPYLTVIKIVLISFIFGSAANLSRYIYNL